MILSFINIRYFPRGVLKTSGLANVSEWKIMFDPYIVLQNKTKITLSSLIVIQIYNTALGAGFYVVG